MTAGKLSLASQGGQQIEYTNIEIDGAVPRFSFFNNIYRRHTNFSIESKNLNLSTTPTFGSEFTISLSDLGVDLIGDIHLEVTLPAPSTCFSSAPNTYANWTNSVGFALIESVSLYIGNVEIDRQSGLWFDVQNELNDPNRKLWPLVGKVDDVTKLKFFQTRSTKYFIPLSFTFNKSYGQAFPLFLSEDDQNQIHIKVKFRNLNQLLVHDNGTVKTDNSVSITGCSCYATCYSLEEYEKNMIIRHTKFNFDGEIKSSKNGEYPNNHVQLIETVTPIVGTHNQTFTLNSIDGSIKELIWVFQHPDRITTGNPIIRDNVALNTHTGNDFFNYSGLSVANNSLDPFTDLEVLIGNEVSYETRSAAYYRQYIPYQYHSSNPQNYVYAFPLSLNPEEKQPSGGFNILHDRKNIQLKFSGVHSGYELKLFAVSNRLLVINPKNRGTGSAKVESVRITNNMESFYNAVNRTEILRPKLQNSYVTVDSLSDKNPERLNVIRDSILNTNRNIRSLELNTNRNRFDVSELKIEFTKMDNKIAALSVSSIGSSREKDSAPSTLLGKTKTSQKNYYRKK